MTKLATTFSVPSAPCYSLVGKIGADGLPFEVGAGYSTTSVAATGELYLGPNDNHYLDNRGTWTAVVTGGTPAPATYVSQTTPVPSTTVAPTPAAPVSAPKATASTPLAYTGVGPKLWDLGLVAVVLALVGLVLYFFGEGLRRLMLWLLGW